MTMPIFARTQPIHRYFSFTLLNINITSIYRVCNKNSTIWIIISCGFRHFLAHYSPLYLAMSWLVQSLVAIKQSLHRINSWALNCGHCLWYPSIPFCSIRLSGLLWLTLSQIKSSSIEYDKMYAFYRMLIKHIHYPVIKPKTR